MAAVPALCCDLKDNGVSILEDVFSVGDSGDLTTEAVVARRYGEVSNNCQADSQSLLQTVPMSLDVSVPFQLFPRYQGLIFTMHAILIE
jgi:hypothetical protein